MREQLALPNRDLPESVAIVAMGASAAAYLWEMGRLGTPRAKYDETWTCNGMGDILRADRTFLMDDLAIQELRSPNNPYVAGLLDYAIRGTGGPLYTAREYERFPHATAYPLEWVVRETGSAYLTNSVPFMLAMAIALGAKRIGIYGCDYAYGGDKVERGRACLEYWCGYARAKGIDIYVPPSSSLLEGGAPRVYGYWSEDVHILRDGVSLKVSRSDKAQLPTAAEIERIMSHAK
jgi:hypothetical protein